MTNKDSFAKRLNTRALKLNSPLCVGLDPFKQYLPHIFGDANEIKNWQNFFMEIIEIIAPLIPSFKPQIGLFEPWGGDGINLVADLSKTIKKNGRFGNIRRKARGYWFNCTRLC